MDAHVYSLWFVAVVSWRVVGSVLWRYDLSHAAAPVGQNRLLCADGGVEEASAESCVVL